MPFIKKFGKYALVAVLAFSLAASPAFATGNSDMSEKKTPLADASAENKEIELNEKYMDKNETDDPEFFKYYTFDEDGNIIEKDEDNSGMRRMVTNYAGKGYKHPDKYKNRKIYDCVDVSEHQGSINWNNVKNAGITHAIIRVAYRGYGKSGNLRSDSYYKRNIENAYNAGIKVGVYIYSQALNKREARAEADFILNRIKPYKSKIKMPVVFDYEYSPVRTGRFVYGKISKTAETNNCIAFCEKVEDAGYDAMVYGNYSMLKSMKYKTLQSKYKIWLAQYNKSTSYPGEFYMWQYSSSGRVKGIGGRVDVNYIYEKKNQQDDEQIEDIEEEIKFVCPEKIDVDENEEQVFIMSDGTTADSCWIEYEGEYYHVDENGYKMTDFNEIDGKLYYFDEDGKALSKKWLTKDGEKYYLIDKGEVAKGYRKIGYYYYLFDNLGVMQKDETTLDGKKYKLLENGKAVIFTAKTKVALNFRMGPSSNYEREGTYKKGKILDITRVSGNWAKTTDGYWVSTKYLNITKEYPHDVYVAVTPYKAKVTGNNVNFRTGPSTGYKSKGAYNKNDTIIIKGTKGKWGKMDNNLWICMDYVKAVK